MSIDRPFAVIPGATSGIGLELAKLAAQEGYALLLAADRPFDHALDILGQEGVETVQVDLSTPNGVMTLVGAIGERHVDVLCANAGHGLGKAFLDEDFEEVRTLVSTNVTGTIELLHHVGRRMRARGAGKILITGSIAGLVPGAYQAAYDASKSFLDGFSFALRHELKDSGVTVTCLMPNVLKTSSGSVRARSLRSPVRAGRTRRMRRRRRAGRR